MSNAFDWPGLLKWSMAYHDETTDVDSNLDEMNAADKAFILNAMDSMVMDELKRIKVLLHVLRLPEDPYKLYLMNYYSKGAIDALERKRTLHSLLHMRQADEVRKQQGLPTIAKETIEADDSLPASEDASVPRPSEEEMLALWRRVRDEKLDALDELQDRIGKRDNAQGLVVFNGLPILARALDTTDLELREAVFRILALVVQHNPAAQDAACREHLIQLALSHLYVEGLSSYVPVAAEEVPAPAAAASVATSFVPVERAAFAPRPQLASSLGYAVVRAALYFLAAQLESHKPAQLIFLANAGAAKVAALLNLPTDVPAADRFLAVRRRALGVLLAVVDECNEARVDEDVARALVELDGRAAGAAVTLGRMEEERRAEAVAAPKDVAPAAAAPAAAAAPVPVTHQLVEVAESSRAESGVPLKTVEAAPVVTATEHPAWKEGNAKVENTDQDTIYISHLVARLVAPKLDLDICAMVANCTDTTGREDLFKLIAKMRAFAPSESEPLCKDNLLIHALEKRIAAIIAHCKVNPEDKAMSTDELTLIAAAKKALAE